MCGEALIMSILTLSTVSPSAPVLGVEAAPELKRWVRGLKGLTVERVPIEAQRATVVLKGGCTLVLSHRSAPSCQEPTYTGQTALCWQDKGCPNPRTKTTQIKSTYELQSCLHL